MNAARYLWSTPAGRLAVLLVLVGVIGLTLHYWAPGLLVGAINRRALTEPYEPLRGPVRVTRRRPNASHSATSFRSPDGDR